MTSPLKSGVQFARADAGGILLDVAGDRYVALSSISATIWEALDEEHDVGLAAHRLASSGRSIEQAEALVTAQLERWSWLGLLREPIGRSLPIALDRDAPVEGDAESAPVPAALWPVLTILALAAARHRYRRVLRRSGLAAALVALQSERVITARGSGWRTLRAYRLWRRLFRQGPTARDCLTSSLALAAVLRRRGVDCELCVGFVDRPFAAHAWVESRGLVLNDTIECRRRHRVLARY